MAINGKHRDDPAPGRTQRPLDQIKALVHDMSMESLTHLQELRDLFDELMRCIKSEDERLQREYDEHGRYCQSVVDAKRVIAEGVESLRNGKLLTTQINSTVTAATKLLDAARAAEQA